MTNKPATNKPTHEVFIVEGEGRRAFWTRIGSGWAHQDGNGINVKLKVLPIDGRLAIRLASTGEQDDQEVGQ